MANSKRKTNATPAPVVEQTPAPAPVVEAAAPKQGSRSIVKAHYKARYGNRQNNGDEIAGELSAAVTGNDKGRTFTDLAALAEVAKANGIDMAKYAHLNAGQQRMNVGNRLRGMEKRGEFVVIGTRKFNEPVPEAKGKKAA